MGKQTRESRLSEWAELVGAEVPERDGTDAVRSDRVRTDRDRFDTESEDPT